MSAGAAWRLAKLVDVGQRNIRILASDEIEFRIYVPATKRPAGIGAIVVLVALVRRQEANEGHHLRVNILRSLCREPADGLLSLGTLARLEDIDRAAVLSAN